MEAYEYKGCQPFPISLPISMCRRFIGLLNIDLILEWPQNSTHVLFGTKVCLSLKTISIYALLRTQPLPKIINKNSSSVAIKQPVRSLFLITRFPSDGVDPRWLLFQACCTCFPWRVTRVCLHSLTHKTRCVRYVYLVMEPAGQS
jgi:hypothetical protein